MYLSCIPRYLPRVPHARGQNQECYSRRRKRKTTRVLAHENQTTLGLHRNLSAIEWTDDASYTVDYASRL